MLPYGKCKYYYYVCVYVHETFLPNIPISIPHRDKKHISYGRFQATEVEHY